MTVKEPKVILVGNPNSGKTAIFNALTGCLGCVGNWAGATSSCCKAKALSDQSSKYDIIDFPGIYDLDACYMNQALSEAEKVVYSELLKSDYDLIINIIDATQLERHLHLTLQLVELNKPMIVVINRIDLVGNSTLSGHISRDLNIEILEVSAKTGWGMRRLKQVINRVLEAQIQKHNPILPERIWTYGQQLEAQLGIIDQKEKKKSSDHQKLAMVYESLGKGHHVSEDEVEKNVARNDFSQTVASARYETIEHWLKNIKYRSKYGQESIGLADRALMHPYLGPILFAVIMTCAVYLAMSLGQAGQYAIEPLLEFVFMDLPRVITFSIHPALGQVALWLEGVGYGIITSMGFYPLMLAVFFMLYLIDESGYMPRSAVALDRLVRKVGLSGEALVSFMVGLGCNVPGLASLSHIKSQKKRVITALMMPFIPCSARFAILSLLSTVFFPKNSTMVLLFLYMIGFFTAFLMGFVQKKIIKEDGDEPTYLLELPRWQWPDMKRGLFLSSCKSIQFVFQSIKYIVPTCTVLTLLSKLSWPNFSVTHDPSASVLAALAQTIQPLFYPLGLTSEQAWPLVVALIMGLIAKEVVVGILSLFYVRMAESMAIGHEGLALIDVWDKLQNTLIESAYRLMEVKNYFIFTSNTQTGWEGMLTVFGSSQAVMAYMVFILLYFPCVSTLFAMQKQIGKKYAYVSLWGSLIMAYALACIIYQVSGWVILTVVLLAFAIPMVIKLFEKSNSSMGQTQVQTHTS